MQSLWIPNWTPTSDNKVGHGVHRQVGSRRKKAAAQIIQGYCLQQRIARAEGKRRVSVLVIWRKGQRMLDKTNIWKCLLDGLETAGALVNDGPKWCDPGSVHYARSDDAAGTLILLEDM